MPRGAALARANVNETPDGLVVDLPSPRRPLMAFVMGAWLIGWAFGFVFMVRQFGTGGPFGVTRTFLLLWCAGWLAAGVWGVGWLAWLVAGRERVSLTATSLVLWRGCFGVGFTRTFPLDAIRGLRTFGREVPPVVAAGLDFTGRGASGVRFVAGGRTVRFARALTETDARVVLDALRARYAFDARPTSSEAPEEAPPEAAPGTSQDAEVFGAGNRRAG